MSANEGRELDRFSFDSKICIRLVVKPVCERPDDKEVTDDDRKCCLKIRMAEWDELCSILLPWGGKTIGLRWNKGRRDRQTALSR